MSEPLPPDRRRNGWYKEFEDRLERHAERVEERQSRFFSKALIAFAVIGLASAIALFGFGVTLKNQNQQNEQIQQERYRNLLISCDEQNEQHDKAIQRAKDVGLDKDSLRLVILLVDELQPYTYNCEAYARDRVGDLE